MSNLFNTSFFNAVDGLDEEEKQQLLQINGAAEVVKRETYKFMNITEDQAMHRNHAGHPSPNCAFCNQDADFEFEEAERREVEE